MDKKEKKGMSKSESAEKEEKGIGKKKEDKMKKGKDE